MLAPARFGASVCRALPLLASCGLSSALSDYPIADLLKHPTPLLRQVRVPLAELPGLVRRLTDMELKWADVAAKYPAQAPASED